MLTQDHIRNARIETLPNSVKLTAVSGAGLTSGARVLKKREEFGGGMGKRDSVGRGAGGGVEVKEEKVENGEGKNARQQEELKVKSF